MIDKTNIIAAVMERLEKLPEGHYIDLRTYKRNRSVLIVKSGEDDLTVIEDGFFRETFSVSPVRLKKVLTNLLKKEFPRSHKIRLYVMGRFIGEAEKVSRKVL